MKSVRLIFLMLLVPFCSKGQLQAYFTGVIGQYGMSSMKTFQSGLQAQYVQSGVDIKNVLNFPMSLQAELGVDYRIRKNSPFMLGVFFNYAITQGKLEYSDYSGQTTATQDIKRYVIGIKVNRKLFKGFGVYLKAGYNQNKLDLGFNTTLNNSSSNLNGSSVFGGSDGEFHSAGFVFEPGINWSYNVKRFFVRTQAGYEMDIVGKTVYDNDSSVYLLNNSNQMVKIDWTGFRLGVGIGYNIIYN